MPDPIVCLAPSGPLMVCFGQCPYPNTCSSDFLLVDPLFMLHHTVKGGYVKRLDPLTYLLLQMVDKIWHDWQNINPANFWSFGGGSVSRTPGFVPDPTFPTGAPPYMNVRSLMTSVRSADKNSRSSRLRSRRTVF